jgi:DNA (cytosine-5)-methyltransferase 1
MNGATLPLQPRPGFDFLSVCSGIEAASVAWAPHGGRAVLLSEIEAFPRAVLRHRHGAWDARRRRDGGGPPLWGDFTALRARHLARLGAPLPDVLVGGTPCQSFSFAGLRRSLRDTRGNLSLDYVRLAHALANARRRRGRAFWAVWENVPGVLSTPDNAFGCFLGALVGGHRAFDLPAGAGRWPDAGMVAGPRARAAWRILDAQYFGLAQRRRRVLVVAGFGDGADPAEILFEPQGLHRHPPPRGGTGAGAAGTLAGGARSRGGYSTDDVPLTVGSLDAAGDRGGTLQDAVSGRLVAFGGNDTRGPIEVAAALNAHGGPAGRMDFESETFVLATTLTARGNVDNAGKESHLVPVAFDARQRDVRLYGDIAGPLDTDAFSQAICFDAAQITSRENRANPQAGGPCPTLPADGRASAITLGRDVGVRRLMPVECERLQGFPDGYTDVPYRPWGAPDGARYKALGNSKPVPMVSWLGQRLAQQIQSVSRSELHSDRA